MSEGKGIPRAKKLTPVICEFLRLSQTRKMSDKRYTIPHYGYLHLLLYTYVIQLEIQSPFTVCYKMVRRGVQYNPIWISAIHQREQCKMSPVRGMLSISQQSLTIRNLLSPKEKKLYELTVTCYHFLLLLSANINILSFMGPTVFTEIQSSGHESDHMVSVVAQTGKCHLNIFLGICVFPRMPVILLILESV